MAEPSLRDCRILVVEDEYMLADELRTELANAGAVVLGPVGTVEDALSLIGKEPHIDGAILDVNLRGQAAYPVAEKLAARGVPFVFATGYDASVIPNRFADVVRCEKPINIRKIAQTIGRIVGA
jgi:DNA-binding response OmpR family regulator